jgi:hypothetical protein
VPYGSEHWFIRPQGTLQFYQLAPEQGPASAPICHIASKVMESSSQIKGSTAMEKEWHPIPAKTGRYWQETLFL